MRVVRPIGKKVSARDGNKTKTYGISQLVPSVPSAYGRDLQSLLSGIYNYAKVCVPGLQLTKVVKFSDPRAH